MVGARGGPVVAVPENGALNLVAERDSACGDAASARSSAKALKQQVAARVGVTQCRARGSCGRLSVGTRWWRAGSRGRRAG